MKTTLPAVLSTISAVLHIQLNSLNHAEAVKMLIRKQSTDWLYKITNTINRQRCSDKHLDWKTNNEKHTKAIQVKDGNPAYLDFS